MTAAMLDGLLGSLYLATMPAPGFLVGLAAGRLAASTSAHHALRIPTDHYTTGVRVAKCLARAVATGPAIWTLGRDIEKRRNRPLFKPLGNAFSFPSRVNDYMHG